MSTSTLQPVEITGEGGRRTVHVGIEKVEIRREPNIFGGECHGLYAHVSVASEPSGTPEHSTNFFVSRLIGEPFWAVDATFLANGFPQHSNGFGARYLRLRTLAPGLAAVLNRAATERGLIPQDAADLPLAIPTNN